MTTNPQAELFVPSSLSLSDIFTSGDPVYQIPDYQRPYSWKDQEIEQLWDDLFDGSFQ